ncbi:MAG: excinuclease ABC subunit UvrA [Sphaerochaetaceae bacterium]|nr:excinuclease ABC subunit UvrA [Sphaerochaetaceae bacterium]
MHNKLIIRGARQHNLKNIDIDLEKDKLIVISGLSGSGKSSLAFDTIFAEGQRRYVESLSAYARQFLGRLEKPAVDYIEGLSPSIAIEQKTTNKNPRSIVGTVSEIYDYYRLLWARIGTPFCPDCGSPISEQSIDQILESIYTLEEKSRIMILSPVVIGRKGEHKKIFEDARKEGYVRVRVDGTVYSLDSVPDLNKGEKHSIEIVVDRLILSASIRSRLADSIESATEMSDGLVSILMINDDKSETVRPYSMRNSCVHCGVSLPDLEPRLFSFNNPFGACPECHGLGYTSDFDKDKIIPDYNKSYNQRAILTHNPDATWYRNSFKALASHYGFTLDTPFSELPQHIIDIILYGGSDPIDIVYHSAKSNSTYTASRPYEGIINELRRRYRETGSSQMRQWMETFMTGQVCSTCHGKKLRKEALSVKVGSQSIIDITSLSVKESLRFFRDLELTETQKEISHQVMKEIISRLTFLVNVGLDYLTLDRSTGTLSGGESQRIRLATQIGSALSGVIYVLDEPSIGLHQKDNDRLISALKALRDIGNTLIVVEHDEATMRAADYIVDLGPGAGVHGGYITSMGTAEQLMRNPDSLTGQYLAKTLRMPHSGKRRKGNGHSLVLKGAKKNNLRGIDVSFPLGVMNVITGVSGSGKSTLLHEILLPALKRKLNKQHQIYDGYTSLTGAEHIDKVISIDQTPIGRTPRSNPATYVGAFTPIRDLFASLPESKAKGYKAGRFSFNVAGGRCEHCKGDGNLKIEMNFLPDVYVTCDVCKGKRFNKETLQVYYKGKNIYDVLDMTVSEASQFFSAIPSIYRKIQTLESVGLGYIKLGQSALTLSGGEAQRVKLSLELSKRSTGKTLYILDEPTTGLHFADVKNLMEVLNRIVDNGNTVMLIEHNMDIIMSADHIVDLGPDGGDRGGELVITGTPEEVARCGRSHTGYYIAQARDENH